MKYKNLAEKAKVSYETNDRGGSVVEGWDHGSSYIFHWVCPPKILKKKNKLAEKGRQKR